MNKYEVIESKAYRHTSGRLASIYGALPWKSERERGEWQLVVRGYTVRNPHTGEVGIGRPPWATREEAQRFADEHKPSRICIGD